MVGLCCVTETELWVIAFSHCCNRYLNVFQTQRAYFIFSCSILSHLCWVLCGPSTHWLCDSILARSTGIGGIWCLISGSVRFTFLQHPQVKKAVNLPKQTPDCPTGSKLPFSCWYWAYLHYGTPLWGVTGSVCIAWKDSPCPLLFMWMGHSIGDQWDGFPSIDEINISSPAFGETLPTSQN